MLDLKKLERKLDEALNKETKENLTEWLSKKREKEKIFKDVKKLVQKWTDNGDIKGFADVNNPKIKAMCELLECDKVQKIK